MCQNIPTASYHAQNVLSAKINTMVTTSLVVFLSNVSCSRRSSLLSYIKHLASDNAQQCLVSVVWSLCTSKASLFISSGGAQKCQLGQFIVEALYVWRAQRGIGPNGLHISSAVVSVKVRLHPDLLYRGCNSEAGRRQTILLAQLPSSPTQTRLFKSARKYLAHCIKSKMAPLLISPSQTWLSKGKAIGQEMMQMN